MEQKQASLYSWDKDKNYHIAAGIDEAGRGCLAGPVVAAAVILPSSKPIDGLADSKKLSAKKRANLAAIIKNSAICWKIGVVWQDKIDRINILNASLEAMWQAAKKLQPKPDLLLIDGNQKIPDAIMQSPGNFHYPAQRAIVRGDALIPSISAASIIAKTFRDNLMLHLSKYWPQYGFWRHKGYGTAEHIAAIKTSGPCPLHRLTFRKVANF